MKLQKLSAEASAKSVKVRALEKGLEESEERLQRAKADVEERKRALLVAVKEQAARDAQISKLSASVHEVREELEDRVARDAGGEKGQSKSSKSRWRRWSQA